MLVKPLVRPIVRAIAGDPTATLGSGFSPTSLFSGGQQGYVYDLDDLSTVYLDSAGTTAASVNGLVGLVLDKSKGTPAARRNLLTYTEQFDNAAWTKVRASIVANSTTAPDGTLTAEKLVEDASVANTHRIYAIASKASTPLSFTGSVYAKKAERSHLVIKVQDGTENDGARVTANLDTGALSATESLVGAGGGFTAISASIQDAGSGWWRVSLTATTDAEANVSLFVMVSDGTSNAGTYTGDGVSGIYIWGAQLEAASSATAYQKVTTGNGDWTPGNHRYQTTTGSKPILRGSPAGGNLVTNGDFASGTDWTTGAGWAIGSGVATATASSAALTSTLTATASKNYRVTYTITRSAGSVQVSFGGRTGASRSAAGTYVDYLDSTTTTAALVFTGTGFSGTVDNVEVVDVSAGSVVAPYSLQYDGVDDFLLTASVDFATVTSDGLARRNLYTNSNGFTAGTGTTITSGIADTPIVGRTTSRYAKTDATTPRYQAAITAMTVAASTSYTVSRYFKYDGFDTTVSLEYNSTDNWGGVAWVAIFNVSSSGVTVSSQSFCTASVVDIGNGWYRAIATFITGASIITPTNPNTLTRITGASGNSVLMAFAQIETGSTASAFQDIGTDKMTVCHGVRKLSDGADGTLVELSVGVSNPTNGSFNINAPGSSAVTKFQYASRGTNTSVPFTTSATYNAPYLGVITGISDIATDTAILRINGSQVDSKTTDQGTGNYGNHVLYFGRRAGTSIPLNGLEYSSICVGKTASASELASIERWVNSKTKAY